MRVLTKFLGSTVLGLSILAALPSMAPAQGARQGQSAAQARTVRDLSTGWRFHFGDVPATASGAGFDDSGWERVALPHTWNRVGNYGITRSSSTNVNRGNGWYRLHFAGPGAAKGRRHFLQFDGVATISEVWVNGVRVGGHRGAYARFRFDITDQLKAGDNLVVVRADNSLAAVGSTTQDVLPLGGDYFVHGGIYRGVSLVSTDSAQIDMLDHGGPGVYITTPTVSAARAEVAARVGLRNLGDIGRRLTLRTTVLDATGRTVATGSQDVNLDRGATTEVRSSLAITRPRLWQGRKDPYMYRLQVELREGARTVDRVVENFGVRTFAFDADRGFSLNGVPTPLHGVSRHQDREGKGWALSLKDHDDDMALMVEMGVNTVRQAHYQHAQEWTNAADKAGMVVWAELPFTHEASLTHEAPSPAMVDNAKSQMVELIRQNYNHPSIMMWALGNETDIGGLLALRNREATIPPQSQGLLRTLNSLAKSEDPTRSTAYADCCEDTDFSAENQLKLGGIADVTGFNRYFGWYYGALSDMGPKLDKLRAGNPGKVLTVSEYGAGAGLSQHTDNPEGGPIASSGRPHPEEFQNLYHERTYAQLKARPWLNATWLWNMFDFAAIRNEGDATDINDKGLVTYDHKTRKDAFYFYKANWSDLPTLYLTGRRYADRAYPVMDVKAYSNAAKATLTLNGRSVGEANCPDHICLWRNVRLAAGNNVATVRATVGGKRVTDSVTWKSPDPAKGLRILAGTMVGATTSAGRFGSDNFFTGGSAKTIAAANATGTRRAAGGGAGPGGRGAGAGGRGAGAPPPAFPSAGPAPAAGAPPAAPGAGAPPGARAPGGPARGAGPGRGPAREVPKVTGATAPELYVTFREGPFRYELPLPDGKWTVTLHFAEPDQSLAATRSFDVSANGMVMLADFNPATAAGGVMKAVTRSFQVEVRNGRLVLDFLKKGGDPMICAIEVSR